ncbi:MAG TPA: hypothetical protein VKK31_17215 [Thermoanaerobaculia bacterium]|nr:hypothetical protein [Thermoanaerobaculia bacterium]
MKALRALGSGLAGACALTLVHQAARRITDKAPRADILGLRALAKTIRATGRQSPPDDQLYPWTLAGDLVSNSLYYSLVGTNGGTATWLRGTALGLGAGLGALALPGPMGLGSRPTNRTVATQVMTVAWYLLGGLAAAGMATALARQGENTG